MIAVRGEVKASKQKLFVRFADVRANFQRTRTMSVVGRKQRRQMKPKAGGKTMTTMAAQMA